MSKVNNNEFGKNSPLGILIQVRPFITPLPVLGQGKMNTPQNFIMSVLQN